MEKISYNLVFNRKKRLNKRGMALVQVEAYLNRKKMYFSTKIYLKPEQWDAKRKMVKNHPNANVLNRMLYENIAAIEQTELGLWQQGKTISLDLLRNSIDKPLSNERSFLIFFKDEIANSSLKESTRQNHLSTLELLQGFKKEVLFTDLTFEFVSSFDNYLQSKSYHLNTIAKHMKHLKRYVNVAINKEYMDIQKYAFRKYKIKSIEGSHTHLAPEELYRFENLQLTGRYTRLQKTKDAFLFCCYAGLRYSDFISLTSANIIEFHQETWIIYKSVKTGIEVRLPLYLLFLWKNTGMCLLLLNARFSAINSEILDAAKIDGAGTGTLYLKIMIPMALPVIIFDFLLSIINSFRIFRESYLYYGGNYPPEHSYTLQYYMNNNFLNLNYQRLSSSGVLVTGLIVVFVLFGLHLQKKVDWE